MMGLNFSIVATVVGVLASSVTASAHKLPAKVQPLPWDFTFSSYGSSGGLLALGDGRFLAWGLRPRTKQQPQYAFQLIGFDSEGAVDKEGFGANGLVDSCDTLGLDCTQSFRPSLTAYDAEADRIYVLVEKALVRLDGKGKLDVSFGKQGMLTLADPTDESTSATQLNLLSNGTFLVSLTRERQHIHRRYSKKDGALMEAELTLGLPEEFRAITALPVLDAHGRGAVTGFSGETPVVCALDLASPAAARCSDYEKHGPGKSFNSSQPDILLLPDGHLILAGSAYNPKSQGGTVIGPGGDLFLKLRADLTPDETFGTRGALFTPGYFHDAADRVYRMALNAGRVQALISKQFLGFGDEHEPRFFPVLYEFDLSGKLSHLGESTPMLVFRPTKVGMVKDFLPLSDGGFFTLGESYPVEPLVRHHLILSRY